MIISCKFLQPFSTGVSNSSYRAFTKDSVRIIPFLFICNPLRIITHFKFNYSLKIIFYEFFIDCFKRVKKKFFLYNTRSPIYDVWISKLINILDDLFKSQWATLFLWQFWISLITFWKNSRFRLFPFERCSMSLPGTPLIPFNLWYTLLSLYKRNRPITLRYMSPFTLKSLTIPWIPLSSTKRMIGLVLVGWRKMPICFWGRFFVTTQVVRFKVYSSGVQPGAINHCQYQDSSTGSWKTRI